ncbi:hypothetical protein M2149_000784 [Lachnospiraceae bacterium PFB1-21]
MYKVIKLFHDLEDGNRLYNPDDTYPRKGLTPTKERIAELLGSDNRQGTPLIAEEKKKPTKEGSK